MGFFSGGMQTLFGGSSSKGGSQSTSGFSLLPTEIQEAYKKYGTQIGGQLDSGNLTKMFTPTPISAGEQGALDKMTAGFAPTAQTIQSDVAMQTNPFDSYVIDAINREAGGQNSILKQNLQGSGQSGSNRQMLGANDIDLSRLQQIGGFKQGQYNTALNNALTVLPSSRQNDADGALSAGNFVRGIDAQTNQAPVTALHQIGTALGILPTSGGSQSSSNSKSSSSKGLFGGFTG